MRVGYCAIFSPSVISSMADIDSNLFVLSFFSPLLARKKKKGLKVTQLQSQSTQQHFLSQHSPRMNLLTGDSDCATHLLKKGALLCGKAPSRHSWACGELLPALFSVSFPQGPFPQQVD